MTRWLRDFRLLPVVLIAIVCLFALKTIGLMFEGGYTLGQRLSGDTLVVTTVPSSRVTELRSPAVPLEVAGTGAPKLSWMQDVFNYPGDVTGSVHAAKPAEKPAEKKAAPVIEAAPESKAAAGTTIPLDQPRVASPGERALLERLQARREELDARARELDLRESMLKAAEKKLQTEATVEKAEEANGGGKAGPMAQRKDDAENARFKGVVTMYETMKPKEAAKIFDRLDIKILLELASQMKPQVMSAILAQMSAEAAERLTVEMAVRSPTDRMMNPANLPKIEGRPSGS